VRNDRHSNRLTDITRVIIAFRNYGNASNKIQIILKTKYDGRVRDILIFGRLENSQIIK